MTRFASTDKNSAPGSFGFWNLEAEQAGAAEEDPLICGVKRESDPKLWVVKKAQRKSRTSKVFLIFRCSRRIHVSMVMQLQIGGAAPDPEYNAFLELNSRDMDLRQVDVSEQFIIGTQEDGFFWQ